MGDKYDWKSLPVTIPIKKEAFACDPFGWMNQPWHLATEDDAPALSLDAIKELIAKLDEKQRQEIYLWLYNLGHRKW